MYDFNHIDPDYLRRTSLQKWSSPDPDVIPLSVADIDFRPPDFIRDALHQAVDEDNSAYGDPGGSVHIREILAEKLTTRNHISCTMQDIMIIPGTMFGIYLSAVLFLKPGDEVIICPSPVYAPFFVNAENAGAVVHHCNWNQSDPDQSLQNLRSLVNSRTRMIMVCNPHNPTGLVLNQTELTSIAAIAEEFNLILFSDELYEDMVYGTSPVSLASLSPEIAQRTISLFGVSKAFGVPGYRSAYLTAGKELLKKFRSQSPLIIVHCDTLSQTVLRGCVEQGTTWLKEFSAHLKQMRDLLYDGISKLPGFSCTLPPATPFLFPDIRATGFTSAEMTLLLKDELKLLTQSGTQFGPLGEGYIRINFATSRNQIQEVLRRLKQRFA